MVIALLSQLDVLVRWHVDGSFLVVERFQLQENVVLSSGFSLVYYLQILVDELVSGQVVAREVDLVNVLAVYFVLDLKQLVLADQVVLKRQEPDVFIVKENAVHQLVEADVSDAELLDLVEGVVHLFLDLTKEVRHGRLRAFNFDFGRVHLLGLLYFDRLLLFYYVLGLPI